MSDEFLQTLTRRLNRYRIPSLSSLIARLQGEEEFREFVRLVKEFLPEREADILSRESPVKQMQAFADYFEDRYFPLDDVIWEEYSDLVNYVPVRLQSVSYDEYEAISSDWRPGYQLLTYLVESPYEEDRAALAEACLKHVSREVLERVPEEGFTPDRLHEALDGTPFRGLALWADVIWHRTENYFIDVDYETFWYDVPNWDRETVEWLTRQWHQAEAIWQEVRHLVVWLEEDPRARFEELLKFIEGRR